MKLPDIYTIGVYGASDKEFFQKLTDHDIDTFCDIRLRRAVRGSQYAFANSQRLQDKFDQARKIQRRKREELTDVFKAAYKNKILSKFDTRQFIKDLEKSGSKKVVLFCVESSPGACHRSLVTDKIKEVYPDIRIFNL